MQGSTAAQITCLRACLACFASGGLGLVAAENAPLVCLTLLVTILSSSRNAVCLARLLPGVSEQSRAGKAQSFAAFIGCWKIAPADDLDFFFLLCAFLRALLSFLADSWSAGQQSTVDAETVPSVGGGGRDMSSLLVS